MSRVSIAAAIVLSLASIATSADNIQIEKTEDGVKVQANRFTDFFGVDKAGLGTIESWRFADSFTEKLEYEIDPEWRGELPLTVLLGRDGSVKSVLGTTDFAELRTWTQSQKQP